MSAASRLAQRRDLEARRSALAGVANVMIATPQMSLEAAADVARKAGITPLILANDVEGEARDVALVHAAIARKCMPSPALRPPCVLIFGRETTVTVRGTGRGGRNAESCWRLASPWTATPASMRSPRY